MMIASAQIGTLRGVSDSASISLDGGASLKSTSPKSNFRTVLEQYHASRESVSKTNRTPGATERKQKDSDPTTSFAVRQQAAPDVEAPRPIHPLTTSLTLRPDATSAPDETAISHTTASPDDTTTQDSTTAADHDGSAAAIAKISPTPTILRGTLGFYSLPRVSDTKTNRAAAAKSEVKSKDSGPPQTAPAPASIATPQSAATPADPSIPMRLTSSTTLEQAATVVQNSSTVSEVPYTASTSTSDRAVAYQYYFSNERPAEAAVNSRASQQQQKVSDPTAAVTVPVPLTSPVGNTVEPPPMHRSTSSSTPSGSAISQDSSPESGTELKNTLPSTVERTDDTTAAPNAGAIAFAARLTPIAETLPPASESTRPAELPPSMQPSAQLAAPATARQLTTGVDVPADAHSGESGSQSNKDKASDLFAKPDILLPQIHVAAADQPAARGNNHASTSPLPPAAQMDQVIEPPAAAPKTNNDITVRIPDSTNQGTAVRFVERAGEVHVSVRTGDAEMAQSLRGGLNDLVNHLEDGGIRTEVWQPGSGSNAASSQNDSHQPFADPDGSNCRQHSSASNSEQESKQQNRPRWVEELEGSIGKPNFKETTQLLWQA